MRICGGATVCCSLLFHDTLALLKKMEMGRVYFSRRCIMVATPRVCKCNSWRSVLNFILHVDTAVSFVTIYGIKLAIK